MYNNNNFIVLNGWDVSEISARGHYDMSIAPDMFVENLETYVPGEPVHYDSGDTDYAKLAPIWRSYTSEQKADAKVTFRNFWRDNRDELTEARRVGSRAKFEDIAFHYTYVDDSVLPDYALAMDAYVIAKDAYDNGKDILVARDEHIANVLEKGETEAAKKWAIESEYMHEDEKVWFEARVSLQDFGLVYGLMNSDKAFFDSVLASRC